MKFRTALIAASALALVSCSKSDKTEPAAGEATAEASAAPAAAAPAAAADGALTEAYLIGKWADVKDGDCKLAQGFLAGGKVDGLFDSWKIEGGNLVLGMMGESQTLTVKVIDAKTMETKNGSAAAHTLTRC
jgi:hypothetical protein